MSNVDLYRKARKVLTRDVTLSDTQVAELCGVPRHVIAGWSSHTPERISIASARREVEQARRDQQQAAGDQQRVGAAMPWME